MSEVLCRKMQQLVRDSMNSKAIFPIRIHVAEGDCMQVRQKHKRTVQSSIRFSHSNPNTTAMRNEISMAQMKNKDYRDATAKSTSKILCEFLLLLVL